MIRSYFIDAIILRRVTARDEWNEPTTSDTSMTARVEWGSFQVRNVKGEQVVASAMVYLPPLVTPTHEDRVIIDGVSYPIIKIDRKADFEVSHWEVYLGAGTRANA